MEKHESLAELIKRYHLKFQDKNNVWIQNWYRDYVALTNEIKTNQTIDDRLLEKIWYEREQGVSSLRQGILSRNEFETNKEKLRELTLRIKQSPNEVTYDFVISEITSLKEQKLISRVYWALINRVFAAINPEHTTSIINNGFFSQVADFLSTQYHFNLDLTKNWLIVNHELKKKLKQELGEQYNNIELNIILWLIYMDIAKQNNINNPSKNEQTPCNDNSDDTIPLNQILYGPPGTGKTYQVIEKAVKAADRGSLPAERKKIKDRYDELVKERRIRFVTFHQSYSYEEFIEGLKAVSEEGQISYEVKSGIFKQMCFDAQVAESNSLTKFENALKHVKEICEKNPIYCKTLTGKPFEFTYHGNSTFRCYPENTCHENSGNGYPASIEHVRSYFITKNDATIYNTPYVKGILKYIQETYSVPDYHPKHISSNKNFVLIIDEINRGNISKIFGELITLIETSKRQGEDEALELTLPYSGEKLSVPNNLYIIGTMNTADRSLTSLDTALRRRFDFIEMMPNYDTLKMDSISNKFTISLDQLLKTMNDRIEALYDRDHLLGHAFFIPVKQLVEDKKPEEALAELGNVFKNKIIPLLQEYFFDDWEKIRLVLGDNQKKDVSMQFIKNNKIDYTKLFGSSFDTDSIALPEDTLSLIDENDDVWKNINAYKGIYNGT